jgi:hypothetical protein
MGCNHTVPYDVMKSLFVEINTEVCKRFYLHSSLDYYIPTRGQGSDKEGTELLYNPNNWGLSTNYTAFRNVRRSISAGSNWMLFLIDAG